MGLSLISASCIAAILTRLICHPLDTLRIHSQLSQKSSLKTNYYKGLGVSLVFSIPGLSSYLSTYDLSKDYIQKSSIFNDDYRKPLFMHSMSAIAAEVVSGLFWFESFLLLSNPLTLPYQPILILSFHLLLSHPLTLLVFNSLIHLLSHPLTLLVFNSLIHLLSHSLILLPTCLLTL